MNTSNRRAIAVVLFTIFLDLVGFSMLLPLLRFYVKDFAATPLQVTLLYAAYSLAQFVFAPIWGRLSDHYGRRPILLISIAAGIICHLLFAAAASFFLVLLTRFAAGAAGANYSIAQAYVADVTPPEGRARGLGLVGAAFGMGFVFGPILGHFAGLLGYRAVPLTAAALGLINLVFALRFVPESLPMEKRRGFRSEESQKSPTGADAADRSGDRWMSAATLKKSLSNRSVAPLMLIFFLTIFGFSQLEATLALYTDARFEFGFRETNYLFILIGIVLVIVQGGLIGPLTRRLGERRLTLVGLLLLTLGLVAFPLGGSVLLLALTTSVLAVANGLFTPSALSLLSRSTSESDQGAVLGSARGLGSLARGIGPLWGGWAFGELGIEWPFWTGAIAIAAAFLVALTWIRKE